MVNTLNTPLGLENSNSQIWNLNVNTSGVLEFRANSGTAGQLKMSIDDNGGGVNIETINDSSWAVQINNSVSTIHQTGMRVTDDGFFEVTNRINGFTGLARLNSTGAWTIESDLTSKQDIESASNLLEKALSLNPISFYYKKQDLNELPYKLMGFIAQEVEEVLPQAVVGTNTKYLDYNAIVPIAIGAIKEIKQYYDEKIANLEVQLQQLKSTLLVEPTTE